MRVYWYEFSLLPGFEKSGVLVPMLPITFIHGKREVPTFALVDSGAESGIISTVIADELNIDWRKHPKKEVSRHPVNLFSIQYPILKY